MLLKFEIIWTRVGQVIRIRNNIDFSETPCTSQTILIFLKHPGHHKRYRFYWNTLFISNDINFTETPCTSQTILFTNPSARAGYDTRSIFKRSLTGLNSEFSFYTSCLTKAEELSLSYYLPIADNDIDFSETPCTSQTISIFFLKHPQFRKLIFKVLDFLRIKTSSAFLSIFLYEQLSTKQKNIYFREGLTGTWPPALNELLVT